MTQLSRLTLDTIKQGLLTQGGLPEAEAMKAARSLCDSVGFPYDVNGDPKNLMWDGTHSNIKGLSAEHVLHELAHWMIASPAQRKEPDFGLGPGPDTELSYKEVPLTIPLEADAQEGMASALGILMQKSLGIDTWDTVHSHGWAITGAWEKNPDIEEALQDLYEAHFIDEDGLL